MSHELTVEITNELIQARKDEFGQDLAEKFATVLVGKAEKGVNEDRNNREALEEAVCAEYADIIGCYAPLVTAWAAVVLDLKTQIPGSQVLILPRDGYPLAEAYRVLKSARGLKNSSHEWHASRVALGIKDEIAHESGTHKNQEDHFQLLTEYWQQAVANGTNGRTTIFADSLPYAYMVETVLKGKESFIVKAGNVGINWLEDTVTDEMKHGLGKTAGTKILPLALYSHTWGRNWPNNSPESLRSVPGVLNMLALEYFPKLGLSLPENWLVLLEAICDGVETIFDPHDTVRSYYRESGGTVKPILPPLDSQLSVKLSRTAMTVFRNHARAAAKEPRYKLNGQNQLTSAEFYADTARHLFQVMQWVDEAAKTGWSHGMLPATTPALSKRADFFNYSRDQGTKMFPEVAANDAVLNLSR